MSDTIVINITETVEAIVLNQPNLGDEITITESAAQGPQGLPGDVSGQIVTNEVLTGIINGSNATFTTAFNFVPEDVQVCINGLQQQKITHFNTSGNNTIIFSESPEFGDLLTATYIKTIL